MEDAGSGRGRIQLWGRPSPAPSGDFIHSPEASKVTLVLLWASISSLFCKISCWMLFALEGHDIESTVLCRWGWRFLKVVTASAVSGRVVAVMCSRLLSQCYTAHKCQRCLGALTPRRECALSHAVSCNWSSINSPVDSLDFSLGSCGWALWTSCEINIFDKPEMA